MVDGLPAVEEHHLPGHSLGTGEQKRIDGLGPLDETGHPGTLLSLHLLREILDLVVETVVAEQGGPGRIG
ncbi:MAG: hypothetical protein ACRDWX_04650 [Acidimicrobiia bacterium]